METIKDSNKFNQQLKVKASPGKGKHVQTLNSPYARRCSRCGRELGEVCLEGLHVCYFCKQLGHVASCCPTHHRQGESNPSKPSSGRVYALDGKKSKNNNLITSMCCITQMPLIVMFHMGVSHSFISSDYVMQLNLPLITLPSTLVVSIAAKNQIETSMACLQCLTSLFDRVFLVDLVCIPVEGLNFILGMD